MQYFDEADIAELAQVAREERQRKYHPEWFEKKSPCVNDDCVVGEEDDD